MAGAQGPGGPGTIRVVGVALVTAGPPNRVLAARRRGLVEAGGGSWELPGGKCGADEPLAAAAVREIEEELGCRVAVTGVLAGSESIRPGLTLEVVTARLVAGEPLPLEHDALRWLTADQLGEVAWLRPDVPFLPQVAEALRAAERGG